MILLRFLKAISCFKSPIYQTLRSVQTYIKGSAIETPSLYDIVGTVQ